MDLKPYVDSVRAELMIAAAAGGDDARALAERLVAPLESAIRLTLLSALSNAADEITRELAPGSVDLRLRGLDPSFVVALPQAEQWDEEPRGATMAPPVDEEGATARINFRPPEHLKARIDEAAGREGLSVNAWLVRAVSGVLNNVRPGRHSSGGAQSYTGWVR
ncbi:hypothetical protein [Catelliglobosispora koreensis]|uniref:hypothetical protein n=1 Tax=Catelliglobosispora koreensis TaxID=129052 RepID=UPI0003744132|nr:hypothetical protein [Catelliglobosispora koreensis]